MVLIKQHIPASVRELSSQVNQRQPVPHRLNCVTVLWSHPRVGIELETEVGARDRAKAAHVPIRTLLPIGSGSSHLKQKWGLLLPWFISTSRQAFHGIMQLLEHGGKRDLGPGLLGLHQGTEQCQEKL